MQPQEVIQEITTKMQKSVTTFGHELSRVRAGRASVSILEGIRVQAYGSDMPLNQVATLSAPDARTIVIQPWDKGLLHEIEKSIRLSDLGLTPANDGQIIRLPVPPLTGERRQELVKKVKKMAEEVRVAIRNIRRDGNNDLKKLEKDKVITEDDFRRLHDQVQKLTDSFIAKCDEVLEHKEKEILEV